jgi:hypothetical protein
MSSLHIIPAPGRAFGSPTVVAAGNLGFARKVQQLPPAVRDNGDKARRVAGLFVNSSGEADTAQQILESGV